MPVLIAGAPRARPPVRTQRTGVFPLFLYHTFRTPRFYCHLRQRLLRPPRPPCLTSRRDHAGVLHTCRCGPHSPCIRPERPVRREGCPTVGRRSSGCSPGSPGCLRRALPSLARQQACRRNGFIIQVAWANGARIVQGRATLIQEVQLEEETRFAGIDVSKAQVDVAARPAGQRWVVTYNETGVEGLVSQLVDLGPALVLLEATGGLDAAGGSAGRCGAAAGGGGQPAPDSRLRQGHGDAGQDRRSGRSGSGSLCRSGPTSRAPFARSQGPGPTSIANSAKGVWNGRRPVCPIVPQLVP